MDKLLQKIDNIFDEHKLLGNHDFTEDEYSLMLEYVGKLCQHFLHFSRDFEKNHHKIIFATLVEITKRWKDTENEDDVQENSRFWDYISKYLAGEDNINQRLYSSFTSIIARMSKQHAIPVVQTGKKYYATLMMHSFAPKNSIFSFFDLCYNIFKKDLDFGFTSDDEELCEIVATQMKNVLGGDYREDKKVSIGSNAYSIKIGLRSFALDENLTVSFIKFIKDTFYQINKLFNREMINEETRLERYIVEWWKNKTESEKISDDTALRKRDQTVSKQNIVAKYIKEDTGVFLRIPRIRLDDGNTTMRLMVYANEEQAYSQEMETKRGELVVTTKAVEFELNKLLRNYNSINIKVEIRENGNVIFDSEKNKSTSLNREFILFEGEKEVLSQINKPTNYFVYSKNIDALKSVPDELTTYGTNLYNIYPKAGENLIGETKQVLFVDKTKAASLGKSACLMGNLSEVEWLFDDIVCVIYTNSVKLMIPESENLKTLELRIDDKTHKLQEIIYEIESNCYQFELKALGLIHESYPIRISLYSYEKETTILTETIIVLPNLDIQFNHQFYYGDIERKVWVKNAGKSQELTWNNQANEITYPLNDGVLLIKIPYFRWRINDSEWHNEPITRKLWYRDFLQNGNLLEIDIPQEDEEVRISGKVADDAFFEIAKNISGKFEIGRAIYANENKQEISVFFNGKDKFELFNIATKEHFIDNPLIYRGEQVYWDVENTFMGNKNNEFFLITESLENRNQQKVGSTNIELSGFDEDVYKVIVKIKDKHIFSEKEKYDVIFEGELLVGSPEKLQSKNERIKLLSANCLDGKSLEWIQFTLKYFIDKLEFIQDGENVYYKGRLYVIDQNGKTRVLNTMENEKGNYDKTNPVRIEFRDNRTLWLVAGWEGGNNFIGNLFCDKLNKAICNIQKQDNKYSEIILYKFTKEKDV